MLVGIRDLENLADSLWEYRFDFGYMEALILNLEVYQRSIGRGYQNVKIRNYNPFRDDYIDINTLDFVWNNLSREPVRFKINQKFESDLSGIVHSIGGTSDKLLVNRRKAPVGIQAYNSIFVKVTSFYMGVRISRHVLKKIVESSRNTSGYSQSLLM